MKRLHGLFIVFFLSGALPLGAAGLINMTNPQYVKVKIYEVRASANADCSNPIRIFANGAPDFTDLTNNPTLGAGGLPNGTYQCFMIKMSDNLHSSPATTIDACTAGDDVVQDVARQWGDSSAHGEAPDGTVIPLTDGEDIVWIYFRVGAVTDNSPDSSFRPSKGMPLTAPIVVTGDKNLTVVFNFDGRVGTNAWPSRHCETDSPSMTIR